MESEDQLYKNPRQEKASGKTIVIQTSNGAKVEMNPEECQIY
jgi:phosphosulfolactate phosphohydrolase-like enzyme